MADDFQKLITSGPEPRGLLGPEPLGFGASLAKYVTDKLVMPLIDLGGMLAAKAAEEIDGMHAALRKYGRHRPGCSVLRSRGIRGRDPCSCGWSEIVSKFRLGPYEKGD